MMTEQLKPTAKISYDHAQVHLAILGQREKYLVTAKNHATGEVLNFNLIQKEIIKKCNAAKKFVITATQMFESMVVNHTPTRAEVTDVANAILDGTDFVMLSEETAVGRYPVDSVDMMEQVIKFTEHSRIFRKQASGRR